MGLGLFSSDFFQTIQAIKNLNHGSTTHTWFLCLRIVHCYLNFRILFQGNGALHVPSAAEQHWSVEEESRGGLICLFCGGASCKREDWKTQQEPSAIRGLHSSWITDDVLAMQRPSSRLLREHGIISQFQKAGIGYVCVVRLCMGHRLFNLWYQQQGHY